MELPSAASVARFWSKVDRTGDCWPWTGGRTRQGYGNVRFLGRQRVATHVAWFLTHGVWPKAQLLHTCDHPPCVRPSHLRDGTQLDNITDMWTKGRGSHGEARYNAKLSAGDTADIRALVAAGQTQTEVAALYGVAQSTISKVVARKAWARLPTRKDG